MHFIDANSSDASSFESNDKNTAEKFKMTHGNDRYITCIRVFSC